jgi:lipopolysaccharide transport system ATP-binding protein
MSSEQAADDCLLRADDVGKRYQLFDRPSHRLRHAIFGRRSGVAPREFWALRGVGFTLRRGEALGLVGRNGSGKSTLLQILAGTLPPTTGRVELQGRVAALLELGSGFNPEFTGRENVMLQGVILGLSSATVRERFAEIAAFADIGDFLERPVKTYSSGMFVRLAFAVHAVLSPDLLIVDEALAVGDAAFQIKCMVHMRQRLAAGMSLVLATHDMDSVRSLCTQALWIHRGEVKALGDPKQVTTDYMRFLCGGDETPAPAAPAAFPAGPVAPPAARPMRSLAADAGLRRWGDGAATITGMRLHDPTAVDAGSAFRRGGRLRLEVEAAVHRDLASGSLGIAFSIRNTRALSILTCASFDEGRRLPPLRRGETVRMSFEFENIFAAGEYGLVLAFEDVRGDARHYHDFVEEAAVVRVESPTPVSSVVLPEVECVVHSRGA